MRINDRVRHKILGDGFIIRIQNGKAQVQFAKSQSIELLSDLEKIHNSTESLKNGEFSDVNSHWKVRTKILACYIQAQNSLTSEFYNFKIRPLPHQFVALKRFIESENGGNMLFADDVGLGKTIEAGLVINHIYQKKNGKARILILVPAGLKWQWREEMSRKFGIFFQIWGFDTDPGPAAFSNKTGAGVKTLIASQQRVVKGDNERFIKENVSKYDLIIVDECHRLSNRDTELYRFVRDIRDNDMTDRLLMLSATPHFGVQDRFLSILHLLRPDELPISSSTEKILSLVKITERDFLKKIIYRNDKLSVKDYDNVNLFRNIRVLPCPVSLSSNEVDFCNRVIDYIQNLWDESRERDDKNRTNFVIAIYKKMLDSSWRSVLSALKARLQTLKNEKVQLDIHFYDKEEMEDSPDEKSEAELTEKLYGLPQIFEEEMEMLEGLIKFGEELERYGEDTKVKSLITLLNSEENRNDKFIIFTQYVRTLEVIKTALSNGKDFIPLIYGALSPDDRTKNINEFKNKEKYRFLISTEAGGEGLNLQFAHKIINFDLPWNPARIQQRIGRVWRYGQKNDVVVYNMHIKNSPYSGFLARLDEKLEAICRNYITNVTFNNFPPELRDALVYHLKMEVLGGLDDKSDAYPEKILNDTIKVLNEERFKAAERNLEEAIKYIGNNRELYSFASDFMEEDELFTPKSFPVLKLFAQSFAHSFNGEMKNENNIINFDFPEGAKAELKMDIKKVNGTKFTLERYREAEEEDLHFFGFGEDLFKKMIDISQETEFGNFTYIIGQGETDSVIHIIEADCRNAESENYSVCIAVQLPEKKIIPINDLFSEKFNWETRQAKEMKVENIELDDFEIDDLLQGAKMKLEKLRNCSFTIQNARISASIGVIAK